MKKYMIVIIGCCVVIALSSFMRDEAVAFPEGYRQWKLVKTHVAGPNNPAFPKYGGFQHIYANDLAWQGYASGNFADGSVIVFDVHESVESKGDHAIGKRKFIDVMVRDSKKYTATGGWGFEEFLEGDKSKAALNVEQKTKCYNCHNRMANDDLVISGIKD